MRIIAGKFRGLTLADVGKGDTDAHLRPTGDRVRESLFNILSSRGVLQGASVLDLFAGTGALGLEALSRGAASVTFVDDGAVALKLLKSNIALARAQEQTKVIRRDATRLMPTDGPQAELIFLDPPYGKGIGVGALMAAEDAGLIAQGATIVWEEAAAQHPPHQGFRLIDQRRYGDTYISIMEFVGAASGD